MPQSIREALAATDYPDARSMAAGATGTCGTCGRQHRPPSLQQRLPETCSGHPTTAAAPVAGTTAAGCHPTSAVATHHTSQETDNGICPAQI